MFLRTITLVLLLALFICAVPAQDVNSGMTGIVKDSSGAVIPGAKVTAVNTGTQARFTATTDEICSDVMPSRSSLLQFQHRGQVCQTLIGVAIGACRTVI